ncbi:hypothetical protein GCM10028806_51640 [Spirosoma terrae]|uniref:Uncharacterized protein n=1 Tax=Spirosoma terrae TaxID=1968276 RepID=A0A6L9LIT4_9BACT|nr:hypothetical protein [Spirosoma terrae]NDU96519.1 hypothetical protein [Spirosoma terrae]
MANKHTCTEGPYRLAQTKQGEIILYADCELWYSFRFGNLFRYLTADEFLRLHDSIMGFDWKQLPAKTSTTSTIASAQRVLNVTLFGAMTRHDLLELRTLLGKAALLVTALSRLYNHQN